MKRVHVIFLGVVYAYAQTWNAMNKLPDGRAQSLAIGYKPITGEQFIYAADDMSWPYRSINEGEWDSLGYAPPNAQCPRVIITNPQDARHVYIARGDGVYYSGDFGETWEHRWDPSLNPSIWTLAMVPGNSGYVYAGCKKAEGYHNTLYYTQDFGRTWYPVEEFPNEWVYDISIYNENWIFVTTHENFVIDSIMITIVNVYRYDGLTWERIYSYIGDIFIKIKVDPNNRQRVFMAEIFWTQEYIILKRSLDGGNNWETIFTLSGYDADIEIGPTGWVYVSGIGEGIYRSQTGNPNSFVNITNNMYDKYILDIKVDPRDQNKVYVGTNFNIYKTHNGVSPNVVWEEFNEGMRKVHPSNFSLCLPSIIYASAKGCIYSTTNMGENWVVKGGSTRDPGEDLITEIAVNPFNENKVIAGVDFNIREGAKIMKTEDGGNLWETTWQTFTWYHRISNCIFNFNNPSIIFFTRQSQPYLLKSIDGGNHWQEIYTLLCTPLSILIHPLDFQILYIGCENFGVIKSTDGGYNWFQTGLTDRTVYSLDINYVNPDILYAGTDNQIWKTKDGGNSWEYIPIISPPPPLSTPKVYTLKLDPEEPSIIYVGLTPNPYQRSDFYISPDAGRSWKIYTQNLPEAVIKDIQIDKEYPDTIFVLTENKGIYWMKTTWERDQLTTSSQFATSYNNGRKIAYSIQENTLWAVYKSGGEDYSDNGGIFITSSSNEGNTWKEKLEIAEGYAPTIDINPDGDPYVIFSKRDEYDNHGLYGIGRILENNQWPEEPWTIIPPDLTNPILCPSFKIRNDGIGFFSVIKAFWRELCVGYFNTRIINPEIHFLPSPATGADLSWQSLTLLGTGNPAVAYLRVDGGKRVCFRYWRDPMHGWSPEEQVTPDNHIPSYPFIDITPEGNPCIVWVHDNKIFFSQRINGVWTSPLQLSPDNKIATSPQIKRLHSLLVVSWKQEPVTPPNGYYEIAYRTYIPGSWGNVEIVDRGDEYRDFPNIEIKETNIDYKIYFLFTKKSEPIYECIFRKRSFIPYTSYLNFSFLSPKENEKTPISREIPIEWVINGYNISGINIYISEDGENFNLVAQNISPGEKISEIPETYKGKYKFLNVSYPTKKLAYKIEIIDSFGNTKDTVIHFQAMPYSQVMNITQGNNARKIVSDADGNIYVVYTTSLIDSSIYDTSISLRFGKEIKSKVYYVKTDDGEKFSVPEFLGYGIEPSIDIHNSLYFIFLSQKRDTIYIVKDNEKNIFTISEPDYGFYSPSFKIDNSGGIHIGVEKISRMPLNDSLNIKLMYYYASSFGEEPVFEIVDEWKEKFTKLPAAPIETTVTLILSLQPLIIDTQRVVKVSPSFSPSISVDYEGKVHIVYDKRNEIFYAIRDSLWEKEKISHEGAYAWNPSMDIYGLNIGITWSEIDTLTGKFTIYRKYGIKGDFIREDTLTDYATGTSYTRKNAGVVWDKDREIVYKRFNSFTDEFDSEEIINSSFSIAKYPQFETYWDENKAYDYFIWTDPEIGVTPVEAETAIVVPVIQKPIIRPYFFLDFKKIDRDLNKIPLYINIPLGKEIPSSFTQHRDGYKTYPSGISVDYAGEQLLYKFPKIFSGNLKFLFEIYYEDGLETYRKSNIKITGDGIGQPPTEDVIYSKGEIKRTSLSLTTNTNEGIIMVHLRRKEGDEVTLKRIAVSSIKDISSGGGIMGKSLNKKERIIFYPVKIKKNGEIVFEIFVPKNLLNKKAKLILYDINGRELKKVWEGNLKAGMNRINYKSHRLKQGAYFALLKIGKEKETRKFMLIK